MRRAIRFFFAAGPGNVIQAHKNWRDGQDDPGQMSVTFSSEFESLCNDVGATSYIVSSASPSEIYRDGEATIEHRPKHPATGWKYHLSELSYGFRLVATAVRFRADYAFIQSGSTHYFAMSLFRLFGIKVAPILHNTLWPTGHPPTSAGSRILLFLDALFFRWLATATLCVSPECARQVDQITSGQHGPLELFTIQFRPELYSTTAPPPFTQRFKLIFAGRIVANKGVFDLLQIMQIAEKQNPGRVTLDICGDGPDLEQLRDQCQKMGLSDIVTIHGWKAPSELRKLLIASHASIVPTRSGFAEGMAMTVIEPVLLGRPVITNTVVPALEVLRSGCVEAATNDPESYARAIATLSRDQEAYDRLRAACVPLRNQFFDASNSLLAGLRRTVAAWPKTRS
jgi:glycosyltransferase involved in cell wall biosynthesis